MESDNPLVHASPLPNLIMLVLSGLRISVSLSGSSCQHPPCEQFFVLGTFTERYDQNMEMLTVSSFPTVPRM